MKSNEISIGALKTKRPVHGRNLMLLLMLVSWGAAASPMEFEIFIGTAKCQECVVVSAVGDIADDTPTLFEAFIQEHGAVSEKDTTVVLSSPGGSLMGGLKMGEIIRANGLSTHIAHIGAVPGGGYILSEGSCASACAYAYLGGQRRSIELQSKYGVHQISTTSDTTVPLNQAVRTTQDIIAAISEYIERMGASPEIATIATRTSDSSIQWISDGNLFALRIVNSSGLTQQSPWKRTSTMTNWSIWSILPDGSRDLLLLSCDEIPSRSNKAGHIKLSLTQSKELPQDHPYYRGYANLPVEIYSGDLKVFQTHEQMFWFNPPGHSTYGLELPISVVREAVRMNMTLIIKISYSSEFPDRFSPSDHLIPAEGLEQALDSLANNCSHLNV